ncbi:MAG: putative hydrolase [uncultured marine phage]|uniref:Putative hydrolase n=1 Tax=uncultured marine phage TaxID=707152 RepID=A0A8D9CAU4_9VIRU|nr:MAG: putative hydrolase [uncultured marine phage]
MKKKDFIKKLIENEIINVNVKYVDFFGNTKWGSIEVNREIKPQVRAVFDELYDLKFPIYHVGKAEGRTDEQIILENHSTGYNFRTVLGQKRLSKHAFGLAVDINPKNNPVKPSKMAHVYDDSIQDGKIDQKIVDLFKKHGFKWGGEIFGKRFWDSHHFEVDYKSYHYTLNEIYEKS